MNEARQALIRLSWLTTFPLSAVVDGKILGDLPKAFICGDQVVIPFEFFLQPLGRVDVINLYFSSLAATFSFRSLVATPNISPRAS